MKKLIPLLAYMGLALTAIPSILVFNGTVELTLHKQLMLLGTALWFIAAPVWFRMASKESKK